MLTSYLNKKKEKTVNSLFTYGEKVEGYEVRVLNEREARAGAGILFVGAFIGLTNGVMLQTAMFSKYFVTFFMIDFMLRVINPRYSPSLLLGRLFVRNQIPEYVGAQQKRFAWMLGLMLAIPMFYYLVIDFQPNPLKIVGCLVCMFLLFFESVFSICFGCKIFNLIKKEKATHCPGGVCELQTKEPVQKFSVTQGVIVSLTLFAIIYGTYAYMTKLETKTVFIKKMTTLFLSQEALDKIAYQKELESFENDDF